MDLLHAQGALLRARLRTLLVPRGRLVGVAPGDAASAAPLDEATLATADRLARAVARVAAYGLFRPACLVRSLALASLLERHRIPGAVVRVGVRRTGGGLEAHAWVELAGRPLGERDEVVRSLVPLPTSTLVRTA